MQVLPCLKPRGVGNGSSLLGAHAEGPFLQPDLKGIHDEAPLRNPSEISAEEVYGEQNLRESVKLITLAPELDYQRSSFCL